ncbi:MAG TPA: bifunctional diaminohydroxyphosphoribosylaminopyrimidine deaminase/5-amino-6-(5-phosphoribosylamino)uracil reductase RibD [Bacteroidales bacterium]|nr:bifunctional diaminohydroxyphosphoribosylaminopyrimidine deaminase/5-amino-6-(5-phosphoribosylamino)uracil reductase RibD [Bacteroidales bacterium]
MAARGAGLVAPNPLVGCVVVHDGVVVGEGYHHRFGGPHAEVVAISRIRDPEVLKTCTLYVNLEPCSHWGKTPPCADLIISGGIPRVVIGCADPNPLVAGKGIRRLRDAGIRVDVGVAEEEAQRLNHAFITFQTLHRPRIILKWAQTRDGFMDKLRTPDTSAGVNWITDLKLKSLVHRWRAETDAILVGAGTVRNDDPELTTREWPGKSPLRIILDREGDSGTDYRVYDGSVPTWIYTASPPVETTDKVLFIPVNPPDQSVFNSLMDTLYQHKILTLLIEGGKETLEGFMRQGLWDEYRVFTGNRFFGQGIAAPPLPSQPELTYHFGNELLEIGYNCKHLAR